MSLLKSSGTTAVRAVTGGSCAVLVESYSPISSVESSANPNRLVDSAVLSAVVVSYAFWNAPETSNEMAAARTRWWVPVASE